MRGYTNAALETICDRWGLVAASKENRIKAIEKILRDPLHVQQAVRCLDSDSARLLCLIGERGSVESTDILNVPALYANGRAVAVLQALAEQGLILACPSERTGVFSFAALAPNGAPSLGVPLLVPEIVREKLPPPAPIEFHIPAAEGTFEPDPGMNPHRIAAAFLETIRIVDVLAPRITASNTVHKSDLTNAHALAAEAGISLDGFSLALIMARELGCVEVRGGRLATTQKAGQWARKSHADRIRDLFQAYIRSQDISDLALFFPELGETLGEHLPEGTFRRTYHKRLAERILQGLEPSAWYSVDAFVETVFHADCNVLFLQESWRALKMNARDADAIWRQRSWRAHEHRLFTWLLENLLAGAGVLELAQGHVFRLTALGLHVLGRGPAPPDPKPERTDAVVIQPDFEVIAYLERCPPELRWRLDTFCERLRCGNSVCTYRFTQESVYRGLRSGCSATELMQMIGQYTARTIPENVREQLATWERKTASIRLRTDCALVEAVTATEARDLARKIPQGRLVGDRFVLLPRDAAAGEPNAALALTGAAVLDYAVPRRPCLDQNSGLTLSASWDKWSLFERSRLDELGDTHVCSDGTLRVELKPERAQREANWGLLAAQLESLTKEPLAERYRMALRTWCGETAACETATATLLRFDDPEVCAGILQLPEAAEHIEGRLGLCAVAVRKGALPKLKMALKELGIAVKRTEGIATDGPPESWAVEWVKQHTAQETEEDALPGPAQRKRESTDSSAQALPSYSPQIVREILDDAVRRRKPVLLQYQSRWNPEASVRKVNPVAVDGYGPTPSLSGYCHQHGGARVFKLARIIGIRVLEDESF